MATFHFIHFDIRPLELILVMYITSGVKKQITLVLHVSSLSNLIPADSALAGMFYPLPDSYYVAGKFGEH